MIPVPRVHAFGRGETLTRAGSTTQAYLILDYVPGQSLDAGCLAKDTRERRNHFYSQLIDILAQMRQLEFPFAGSLIPDPNGGPDPIIGPLSSIHINELQVQGFQTAAPRAAFKSATDFVLHQLSVMSEAYRLPMSEQTLGTAQCELFALTHLERELSSFTNADWDEGPFVLSHLDLRWPNIIVNDDLDILAIIDWEWTGSIPRQLFTPPFWIAGRESPSIAGDEYREEFTHFRKVILKKSETSDLCRQLAEEWDVDLLNTKTLPIAELLRHHSQLIAIFYQALYPKLFEASRDEVVPQFFERSENRELASEVQRRWENSERYTQYLKDNQLFVPNKELELTRRLAEQEERLQRLLESARRRIGFPIA